MTEPGVSREIERKLEVPARFRVPPLAGVAGVAEARPQPTLKLTAVYYDTADLRLARSHVTLRRRVGGHDDGWHLKLPVVPKAKSAKREADTRDELHLPLTKGNHPPAALEQMVLGITRGARLSPVATLRNERRPVVLLAADGSPIAELTDDRVTVVRGGKVTERFREVEVEAAHGRTMDDLTPIVDALVARGASHSGFASKAGRALGEAATAPADIAPPRKVHAHDPAAEAITAHITRHAAALVRADLWVRRGLPDGVHQMRVAARQLRSGLRTFGPLLDQEWAKALRGELGWLAGELGAARDREVLEARLCDGLQQLSVPPADLDAALALVHEQLGADALAAAQRVDDALNAERYRALLESLVEAARAPRTSEAAEGSCAQVLPPLMRRSWRRLQRDADELRRKGPDSQWHAVRLRAKQSRYALDALAPVFGRPAREWAQQLVRITELLGTHQDAAIAAEATHLLAVGADGNVGFVMGLLHDAQRAEVAAARKQFLKVWPEVSHPRWRRWVREHR
jgi:inorganic triphosphatase YgiF